MGLFNDYDEIHAQQIVKRNRVSDGLEHKFSQPIFFLNPILDENHFIVNARKKHPVSMIFCSVEN